jgi:hypothetical protein
MKYRYAYVYRQTGPSKIELFGTDTRLSNDELELMRRKWNKDLAGQVFIPFLALAYSQEGMGMHVFADSRKSKLAPEPLFVVE